MSKKGLVATSILLACSGLNGQLVFAEEVNRYILRYAPADVGNYYYEISSTRPDSSAAGYCTAFYRGSFPTQGECSTALQQARVSAAGGGSTAVITHASCSSQVTAPETTAGTQYSFSYRVCGGGDTGLSFVSTSDEVVAGEDGGLVGTVSDETPTPPEDAPAGESNKAGATFADFVNTGVVPFVDRVIIPLLYAILFLLFIFGIFRYFFTGGEENREKGKPFILWSIIAMVAVFAIWGILNLLLSILSV